MEKILEKLAMILMLFGFRSLDRNEKNRAYVWRAKNVNSCKVARNYVLAIARTLGTDYSFGVRYTGPRGMVEKIGKCPCFIQNRSKNTWPTRWTLDIYHKDDCIGTFVFFIQ